MKRFFLISLIIIGLLGYKCSVAQKCPRNAIDCKGACGWFIDTNNDGYCDYTTFSEALMKKTIKEIDSIAKLKKNENENKTQINDSVIQKSDSNKVKITNNISKQNNNIQSYENKKYPLNSTSQSEKNQTAVINPITTNITTTNTISKPVFKIKKYDLFSVFFTCIILYLITLFLVKIDIIKKRIHRKIWNSLLLITFLVTGLLGLMMVIQLNYQILFNWFKTLLYWHVEFGISMAAISILHILWHWKYFINIFKKHKKENKN